MLVNGAQRRIGADNYQDAVKITRRRVLSDAAPPDAAGIYWGYGQLAGKDPVRVGIIGAGNQGRAHIGAMNPDYLQVVAFSDIRPSNQRQARMVLKDKYGAEAAEGVKLYEDYKDLLKDDRIEMVIVALPLHLHYQATQDALQVGKHVLCEKLMAAEVIECKKLIRAADTAKRLLAVGHQRHYSYLYANCRAIIEQGAVLGDVRHIRAYWHRNQTNAGAKNAEKGVYDGWRPDVPAEDSSVDLKRFGYDSYQELVCWRAYKRTGGGLMGELGSQQLDAAGSFLGNKHPTAVHGTGLASFFDKNQPIDPREVDDHIFLTFEYGQDASNAVVTYSSIETNAFEGFGEQVMGTKGTLIVQEERDAYIFREPELNESGSMRDTRVSWPEAPVTPPETQPAFAARWVSGGEIPGPLTSRGYREELEHMAWLIRNPDAIVWPTSENPYPENDSDPAKTRACRAAMAGWHWPTPWSQSWPTRRWIRTARSGTSPSRLSGLRRSTTQRRRRTLPDRGRAEIEFPPFSRGNTDSAPALFTGEHRSSPPLFTGEHRSSPPLFHGGAPIQLPPF
jgi:predicted dehydrogenase